MKLIIDGDMRRGPSKYRPGMSTFLQTRAFQVGYLSMITGVKPETTLWIYMSPVLLSAGGTVHQVKGYI